jgi:hypothetical protein
LKKEYLTETLNNVFKDASAEELKLISQIISKVVSLKMLTDIGDHMEVLSEAVEKADEDSLNSLYDQMEAKVKQVLNGKKDAKFG